MSAPLRHDPSPVSPDFDPAASFSAFVRLCGLSVARDEAAVGAWLSWWALAGRVAGLWDRSAVEGPASVAACARRLLPLLPADDAMAEALRRVADAGASLASSYAEVGDALVDAHVRFAELAGVAR